MLKFLNCTWSMSCLFLRLLISNLHLLVYYFIIWYCNCLCRDLWTGIHPEKKSDYAYLDSLWFDMYITGKHKSKVLKWVKAKKIFTRRYVFVPIVYWYVARFLILHNHLFDWHDTGYSLP